MVKPDVSNIEVCLIGKCESKGFSIRICVSNAGCHHQISRRCQSYPQAKLISASNYYKDSPLIQFTEPKDESEEKGSSRNTTRV